MNSQKYIILLVLLVSIFLYKKGYAHPNGDTLLYQFVERLHLQPVKELPFSIAPYLFDSLEEVEYNHLLHYSYIYNIDTINIFKNDSVRSLFQIDSMSLSSYSNLGDYYFLTELDCKCYFSMPAFFKRFPPINTEIEVFTVATSIRKENGDPRGIIITLYIFNSVTYQIIDQHHILTAGVGGEDIPYYEGFIVYKDYSIDTYSYTYNEVIGIETKIKFLKNCKHYLNRIESITKHTYSEYDEDCDE